MRHGLGNLREHVASWTSNQGGSKDLVGSFSAVDLVNASFGLAGCSVQSIKEFGVSVTFDSFLLQSGFIVANRSNLKFFINLFWQNYILFIKRFSKECVPYNVPSMDIVIMGKFRAWDAIANGIHIWVRCLEVVVHQDARVVKLNTSLIKAEILYVWNSTFAEHNNIKLLNAALVLVLESGTDFALV